MSEDKNVKQLYLDFDEYIRQGEPEKKDRASGKVCGRIVADSSLWWGQHSNYGYLYH